MTKNCRILHELNSCCFMYIYLLFVCTYSPIRVFDSLVVGSVNVIVVD